MALLHRFLRLQSDESATSATTPPASMPVTPRTSTPTPRTSASMPARRTPGPLPPSVARVAARTRLSAEILAAVLEIEERSRATLDDIERADALADRLIARHRDRRRRHAAARTSPIEDRTGVPGNGLPGARRQVLA